MVISSGHRPADLPKLNDTIVVAAFEGWNDAGDAASDALELFRPASQVERASHGGVAFGVRGTDLRVIAVRAEEPCP